MFKEDITLGEIKDIMNEIIYTYDMETALNTWSQHEKFNVVYHLFQFIGVFIWCKLSCFKSFEFQENKFFLNLLDYYTVIRSLWVVINSPVCITTGVYVYTVGWETCLNDRWFDCILKEPIMLISNIYMYLYFMIVCISVFSLEICWIGLNLK